MPFVEREGGVAVYWEESGDGPGLLLAHSYIQHPGVFEPLLAELRNGHRTVRFDVRGAGASTREGPYDMETDVGDLIAVAEAAGPITAVLTNGDATNRAVYASFRRPDVLPYVVSLETFPLHRGVAAGTDALVGSRQVLEALVAMMRADYRSGLTAALQRGNPNLTEADIRARIDATVAYIGHAAALGRLEAWIADDPGDEAATLGNRLIVAYEGAGGWFPAELTERVSELLPEAQFVKLGGGVISRPDLTAVVVRSITGAAASR